MAFPVVLEAPVATNPWSHRWGLSPFRITGTVTSRTEDAEGNQFTPDRMNWSQFLREGYLDIDHAYFNNHIEAAIIGVPETVIIWADHVEVTFRLVNRPDTEAIYQYIHDHPNLLGYSIAGPLQKALFDTNGTWPAIVSVALTHAPINADTNAVALSSASRFFALYATAQRIVQDRVRFASAPEWRRFFLETGWSLSDAHALSQWAMTHEMLHKLDSAPIRTSQLLENLLVPPDALEPLLQSIRDELDAYWHTHPGDPHFTRDGRFNSVKEAIQHLKYCQHLTKEQVAHIVGAIRMRPEFIVHPPGNPPTAARKES